MSEATDTMHEAANETVPEQAAQENGNHAQENHEHAAPEKTKGQSVIAQAAGVGMAMLGSSTAGNAFAGNSMPHADHGHSVARWTGAIISMVGFLVGGVLFPFAMVPASIVGGALQVVAIIAVVTLNAAGFGRPDVWGELKSEAAAERAAA